MLYIDSEVIEMKRTLLLALAALLCWSGLAIAEDGLSIAFMPDKRAPSLSIAGIHSLDLGVVTLVAKWEFGQACGADGI